VPGRDEMLARVREALGRGKTMTVDKPLTAEALPAARLEGVMPPIADLLAKFEEELKKVSGVPHRAASIADLDRILGEILGDASSVVLSRNPLLRQLGLGEKLRGRGESVAEWPATDEPTRISNQAYREACFTAPVGITGADWVLAETGSLVLTSSTEGSQLASLAPPVHVALFRRGQLLESLDDILERLPVGSPRGENPAEGRSVVFVTGVSRTADIEQILIRGVHGPRELHAILVEENCLDAGRADVH
jgi:L-lactate dehydrogenase complex protein LldG